MEVVLKFFQGFINMGASTLLPFVIAILGIFFGMKIGRAIKAGLLVGIGFQGLVLAVNLLITSVTPAMQYYKDLGSGYDTLEIGFRSSILDNTICSTCNSSDHYRKLDLG